jgi:RNA polymerase sigma-70 factor (ECF subfamily)
VSFPSDEQLMQAVSDGDIARLTGLFDRFHIPLFNFFLRMGSDRHTSEDMVQDVFMRVLKYRSTWQPNTSFRTWLYQIARNVRIDYFRKRRMEEPWDESLAESLPQSAPRDLLADREERAMLRRALIRLPEEKREVLLLSRFHELKYEEIGKLLGCETGAVKVRVFRALRELREIFFQLSGRNRAERANS